MLDLTVPFSFAQARQAGLSERRLKTDKEFVRLYKGVYLGADVPITDYLRCQAALMAFGMDAYISHSSAARIRKIPVRPPRRVTVTVQHENQRRTSKLFESKIRPRGSSVEFGGLRVSETWQNFFELCEELPLVESVIAGDFMLQRAMLPMVSDEWLRHPAYRPRFNGVIELLAIGSESPMESRTRLLLVLAGLPRPIVNFPDDNYRLDLAWPKSKLAVEYDGRHHNRGDVQWQADLVRRERLENRGWKLIVLTSKDLFTTPDETIVRVHTSLTERNEPGTSRRISHEWQVHFAR
jgi:hypothetical protein